MYAAYAVHDSHGQCGECVPGFHGRHTSPNHKCQPHGGATGKIRGITGVSRIHPLGTLNVSPASNCRDVLGLCYSGGGSVNRIHVYMSFACLTLLAHFKFCSFFCCYHKLTDTEAQLHRLQSSVYRLSLYKCVFL